MSSFWSDRLDSGVYQIRNTRNGKAYVGSAANFRIRSRTHLLALRRGHHHSAALQRSWDKYGEESFVFEVIEACSREDLISREQIHLDRRGVLNCCKTAGSSLGRFHSVETRKKISDKAVGRKQPERDAEYRKKRSDAHRGKAKPDHVMAALQRGRRATEFTQERKDKVAKSLRAAYSSGLRRREKSAEHAAAIGRTVGSLTDEEVRAIRAAISLGETGRSLAEKYSVPPSTVSEIKNGKTYRWVDGPLGVVVASPHHPL